jgi:hypothetical protein
MAITSLVDGITGVGPTGQFLLGANTIAPYAGTSVIGLTDGTSAATASKNVAEIYNEIIFDKRIIIEKSGLTFDPADNSQLLRAIQKLANYSPQSYGTFASVAAPTAAPSEANPQTVLTNANQEVFAWTGTKWALVADGYNEKVVSALTDSSSSTSGVVIAKTWTAPRTGKVKFSVKMDSIIQKIGVGGRCIAYLFSTIDPILGSTTDFSYGDSGFLIANISVSVGAGQVVSFGSYGNGSSVSNNSGSSNGITAGMVGYQFTIIASMTYET